MFAHLKLRAEPIAPDALDTSPTMHAVVCADRFPAPAQLTAADILIAATSAARC